MNESFIRRKLSAYVGSESCGDDRKVIAEALTGEDAGRVLSLEKVTLWGADDFPSCGTQQRSVRYREGRTHPTFPARRDRARIEASYAEAGRSKA